MHKKAFTLFETILAIIIFSTIIGIIFSVYFKIKSQNIEIQKQTAIVYQANDFLEKIQNLSIDYTIDYEEYFNRRMSDCVNWLTWVRNNNWSCDIFSNYGNWSWNTDLYYCSSDWEYRQSWYNTKDIIFWDGCWHNNTWNQTFGQYNIQFWDITDIYLNDWNDIFLWLWPVAIFQNTWVQELYLINNSWDHRVFFRRHFITWTDLNWDWYLTWKNESLYKIQMLQLKWFDAWENHNFNTWDWWIEDWFIDTWACDTFNGFVCSWGLVTTNWEEYRLPSNQDDWRLDLTNWDITISFRNFEIIPSKNPYLATKDLLNTKDPFVKINITYNNYWFLSNDKLFLQTSIWFKNNYKNFPSQTIDLGTITPWVCGDWILHTWLWEQCDDWNTNNWDWCDDVCTRETRLQSCDPIDTAWHQIYYTASEILQQCYAIDPSGCIDWLPETITNYSPNPSNTECFFTCYDWYTRNELSSQCISATQTWQCSAIDTTWHQIYNTVEEITQNCIWTDIDGCVAWLPSTGTIYSYTWSTTKCYFTCEWWYLWSWDTSTCEPVVTRSTWDFITIRQTDLSWSTNDYKIEIPTFPWETYNYNVDCDNDGIWEFFGQTWNTTCTYANTWRYEVRIWWQFPRIYFYEAWDREKLLSIKQRWDTQWTSMYWSFTNCKNFGTDPVRATDNPDLSNVTSMQYTFAWAENFNQDIWSRDVSNVNNLSYTFWGATNFNQDIWSRDTSNVTDIRHLFNWASSFNQDIWWRNTSWVEIMRYVFNWANSFNQDISSRNVSNVTDMDHMFAWADLFNQNIWWRDTSSVTDMKYMFFSADSFNQNIWWRNISNVTDTSHMFNWAIAFNQDIWSRDTSSVTNMSSMFANATNFNQDIWWRNTSIVSDMNHMFASADSFNQNIWWRDVSKVRDFSSTFQNAHTFNQDIWWWTIHTNLPVNMSSMFEWAHIFNQDIWWRNTSNVTNMNSMFKNAYVFNQNIWWRDTSAVTDMWEMFSAAYVFNQDIWWRNTSNVTTMFSMFNDADSFNKDLTWRDVSQVKSMRMMFANTNNFNWDITNWNTVNLEDPRNMFNWAIAFNQDIWWRDVSDVSDDWYFDAWAWFSSMFEWAVLFNQDLSSWDVAWVNYFQRMFKWATSFNQDLSSWDVSSAKMTSLVGQPWSFTQMFDDSWLSKENYDAILIGWSSLTYWPTDYPIELWANNIYYCNSESQRNYLSWTLWRIITDAWKHISCP